MAISIPILILAVLWAAFFVWPVVQRKLAGTRRDSVGDFSKRVSTLGRVRLPSRRRAAPVLHAPRPVAFKAAGGPRTSSSSLPMSPVAQKRRRDALALFAVAAFATLVLAIAVGGTFFWALNLLADALFVGFVAALIVLGRRAQGRKAQVHHLPRPAPAQSSALVLRRTGSS